MSTTEEQIASTESTPAPIAPIPPEIKPPDPNDRHAVLKAAFEKPPTERGRHAAFQPREQGKFAPGAPVVPIERPKFIPSLKKEVEAHWNTAPVELLQEIVRREEDHTKGVQPLKEAKTQLDDLLNEFKPYEDLMRSQGGTPKTVVQNLLQTASVFHRGTPLQRAQSIAGLMQQFGIPLAHIQQMFGTNPQGPGGQQPALDPQYNALAQQVQSMQSALTQRQQQEQQQNETRALTTIQKFAADPAHPHFEAVQERMLQLLQAPQVLGVDKSTMSYEEQLQAAYATAIRLDPAIFAQVQAAQQVSQQQPALVQKSKAAAVQVTGAPASGPAPKIDPNDRREILRNAFNRGR